MRRVSLALAFLLITPALATAQERRAAAAPLYDVYEKSIAELQRDLEAGKVTSVALVDAYTARIRAYDFGGAQLNAIIRLNPRARAEAAALDAERRRSGTRGQLHGIPIILKDNFDTKDLQTTAGSVAFVGHIPSRDAFVVDRLRAAGAIILAKSNMDEFAAGINGISSLGGQTRNTFDPRRCATGSSAGTGVAIAASFAAIGWGTDTCNSIRGPSSQNSLFGLRPSQGLFSRDGVVPLSHTQDVVGPLARTVEDLAIGLDATLGADPNDELTKQQQGRTLPQFRASLRGDALRGARIGYIPSLFRDYADTTLTNVALRALQRMKQAGAEIVEVPIPGLDSLMAASGVITYEFAPDMEKYLARTPGSTRVKTLKEIVELGAHHERLERRLRREILTGPQDSAKYAAAMRRQTMIRDSLVRIMDAQRLDALAYPTMRTKPVFIGETSTVGGGVSLCSLSASTGLPAVTMPAGMSDDGFPIGLELIGRAFTDARLVSIAYGWEQLAHPHVPAPTAPRLVNGRRPAPIVMPLRTAGFAGRVTYDPVTLELSWALDVTRDAAADVYGVVLRRHDDAGNEPVIQQLVRDASRKGTGSIILNAAQRTALHEGRFVVSLFSKSSPAGETRARLSLPR